MFQFHKVRLKVHATVSLSGATMFQFHKVRLKVSAALNGLMGLASFNSIRYD